MTEITVIGREYRDITSVKVIINGREYSIPAQAGDYKQLAFDLLRRKRIIGSGSAYDSMRKRKIKFRAYLVNVKEHELN